MSTCPNISFDLRLVELEDELRSISEYRKILEWQIAHVADQKRLRVEAALVKEQDIAEHAIAYNELYNCTEGFLPRFARGTLLMAYWALLESAIKELSEFIADERELKLRLKDISGRSPRDKWTKYFTEVIEL